MRNSEGEKTYILLVPFHLIVYNRPREFRNSSGLFSLVGKCLQTWEEKWDNKPLTGMVEHDGFGVLNISIRSGMVLRINEAQPLGYGLLLIDAHVEQHWKYP